MERSLFTIVPKFMYYIDKKKKVTGSCYNNIKFRGGLSEKRKRLMHKLKGK